MSTFSDTWSQAADLMARSKKEHAETEAAVKACKGWRFGGCPDGMLWRARHREHGEVKRRTSAELVAEVRRLDEQDRIKASGPAARRGGT